MSSTSPFPSFKFNRTFIISSISFLVKTLFSISVSNLSLELIFTLPTDDKLYLSLEKNKFLNKFSAVSKKFIKGRHYSAHFAASKTGKIMIGFTEQPQTTWEKLRKKDNPFLLKRSLYVHNFNRQFVQNISMQIDKIMSHFDLVGLNSIDFIVPKNSKRILITEINPRPGATIDLLERATGKNLFNLHIQSIRGENITRSKKNQKKNKKTWVMEIIYAKRNLRFNQPIHWPIWIKDIPNLRGHSNDRVHIKSGGPVCTIFADGNNRKSALKNLTNRVKLLNNNLAKHLRD